MNASLLAENLQNPALLFFVLGLLAVWAKSDLEVPPSSSKFISMYLLLSIGFKGGQELSHSSLDLGIVWSLLFGILLAAAVPIVAFFVLRRRYGVENAGAVAAAYGSVSAVTFVTAVAFLEMKGLSFGGHMVAVMALMEAPAIVVGVLLVASFSKSEGPRVSCRKVVHHAVTNGSVLLILGSLVIGFLASEKQAEGIRPFTTDLFKGFLAVFLLDMGVTSGRQIGAFRKHGWTALAFGTVSPLVIGSLVAWVSQLVSAEVGDRFLFAVLAASASYIAVPAAMKLAVPKADAGLYLPMALAITFPFNITLGIPIYMQIIATTG